MARFGILLTIGLYGLSIFAPSPSYGDPYVLIVCGSGGQDEYRKQFTDWGVRLSKAFTESMRYPKDRVELMLEFPEDSDRSERQTSELTVKYILNELAHTLAAEDDLILILIGHGSYIKRSTRFHVPGPDLSADDLKEMLQDVPCNRLVLIDSTPSSAGFINVLSGENHILCTATKSVEEANATRFMEFFVSALEDGSADRNRDDRISVFEACTRASELTQDWYKTEGLLATENALLDDNGDGLGTRIPIETDESGKVKPPSRNQAEKKIDGDLAAQVYLKEYTFPENAPQELVDVYLSLLEKVEALKAQKSAMNETDYYQKLEELLISAAKTHRQIRRFTSPSIIPLALDESYQ